MNRSRIVRLVAAFALASPVSGILAQQALEIIPLRHRTVDQVLPALQPLVEPGGTLSGTRGQLFLRTSPSNAAEIKRALEVIDRPPRRLQISVRLDDSREHERREVGASGTVSNRGAHIDITAADARRGATERVDQRVQVLEGGRAMIFTGQSRPLDTAAGTVIQDLASGFEVVPRLSGSDVILDVYQQRESAGARAGGVESQRMASTVRARPGEWIEIGGAASDVARDDRGIASASASRAIASRRVWVKVEELP